MFQGWQEDQKKYHLFCFWLSPVSSFFLPISLFQIKVTNLWSDKEWDTDLNNIADNIIPKAKLMSDRFAIINVFSEMNLVLFFYHDERDLGFIPISIRRQKLMELKITQSSKSQKNIWAAAWTSLFVLKRLKFSKLLSLWQVLFRSLFLSNLNPCENPILKECKSPSLIFNKLLSFINLK